VSLHYKTDEENFAFFLSCDICHNFFVFGHFAPMRTFKFSFLSFTTQIKTVVIFVVSWPRLITNVFIWNTSYLVQKHIFGSFSITSQMMGIFLLWPVAKNDHYAMVRAPLPFRCLWKSPQKTQKLTKRLQIWLKKIKKSKKNIQNFKKTNTKLKNIKNQIKKALCRLT